MVIRKLIRCANCNQIIPNYEGYELTRAKSLPGVEWSSSDLAAARKFLLTHSGHPLDELLVEEDSWVNMAPAYEPFRESYFLAGNKERKFLVRRKKSALDRPASYEIVPGRLKVSNVSLKIQEDDLRKQIFAEEGFSPLLKERMERFIQVFRDEMARISPERVEEEVEDLEESESSALAYGGLKNARWERILNRCRLYFDESELRALRRFVDENRNPPDVLSIRIERQFSIISLAEAEPGQGLQEKKEAGEAAEPSPVAISKRGPRRLS